MEKKTASPAPRQRRRKTSAKSAVTATTAVSAPISARDVRDLLAFSLGELTAGRIDSTHARAISSCAGMLLRAIQTADLEIRISRLEALAKERA